MAYSKAILLLGLLVLVMMFSEVFSRELAEEGVHTENAKEDGYGGYGGRGGYGGGYGGRGGGYGGGYGGRGGGYGGRGGYGGYGGRGGYGGGHGGYGGGGYGGGYGRGHPPATKQGSAASETTTEAGGN